MIKRSAEPYIATYLHQKAYHQGKPIAANFELTARCNFSCPMCYVHQKGQQTAQRELTAQQWLSLGRQMRDEGVLFVLLTGGEPFIRPDFFEIYQGLKAMGMMISINSNGSLLQGNVLEQLLEDPPFRINISLYGGSNDTYQRMCGVAAYDSVKDNIRKLKQAGVDVSLNLSITPYNKDDLSLIYQDAVELGVNVRASSYMYPPVRLDGVFGCGNRLDPKEAAACGLQWDRLRMGEAFPKRAEELLRLAKEEKEGCGVELGQGVSCRAGSTSCWVTWDGKMMPCGMMTMPVVYPLQQGFADAWQELRKKTAEIRLPGKCSVCPNRELCSVCAAVCLTETGHFDGVPDYVCQKTAEYVRLLQEDRV